MIIGNVIKFGYGDLAIGTNQRKRCMTITPIRFPKECGGTISSRHEDVDRNGTIVISEENIRDIYNLLCTVNKNNRVVRYNQWIFDFSNYNQGSVNRIRIKAWRIVDSMAYLSIK